MPTRAQLAVVHIAKKELHLTDETYRDILFALFKKESARDLAPDQISRLIDHFKSLGWKPVFLDGTSSDKKRGLDTGGRGQSRLNPFDQARPAQLRKIVAMWMTGKEIHQKTMQSLLHFLNARFHIPDLRFVKAGQVTAILAAIRRMAFPHHPEKTRQ